MSTLCLTDALCPSLNVAIQVITNRLIPGGFDIRPDAPSTFRALTNWLDRGQRMAVSSDGLEGSIYASAGINAMFRAWHDWRHYTGHLDFSPDGEHATYKLQAQDLIDLYGEDCTVQMRRVLFADIVGQSRYYRIHRKFVKDQMGFVRAYLRGNENLVLLREW